MCTPATCISTCSRLVKRTEHTAHANGRSRVDVRGLGRAVRRRSGQSCFARCFLFEKRASHHSHACGLGRAVRRRSGHLCCVRCVLYEKRALHHSHANGRGFATCALRTCAANRSLRLQSLPHCAHRCVLFTRGAPCLRRTCLARFPLVVNRHSHCSQGKRRLPHPGIINDGRRVF